MRLHLIVLGFFLSLKLVASEVEIDELTSFLNPFTFKFLDLYYGIVPPDDSLLCSPLSIAVTLMMASEILSNDTADQIQDVLSLKQFDDDIKPHVIASINRNLNHNSKAHPFILKLINKMFIGTTYNGHNQFKTAIEREYQLISESMDFRDNSSKYLMTDWIEMNFHASDSLSKSLDANTEISLLNGFDFYFGFLQIFESLGVQNFYLENGEKKKIQMLNSLDFYFYGILPDRSAEFVEIPLMMNDKFTSLIILLPHKNNKISDINFSKLNITQLFKSKFKLINLTIPELSFTTLDNFSSVLYYLKLYKMFRDDPQQLDASLLVESIRQSSLFKLNQFGITSTSISNLNFISNENQTQIGNLEVENYNSYLHQQHQKGHRYDYNFYESDYIIDDPIPFEVNHPFYLFITDNIKILFSARITNP